MDILVVHRTFSPAAGAEAICTAKLLRALHGIGVNVTVLTERAHGLISGLRVVELVPPRAEGSLQERAMRLLAMYPEGGFGWSTRAAKHISILARENHFDFVYTRAMPFVNHLAGWYANLPQHTRLTAHFSDPFPDTQLFGDRRSKWRLRWHRRVVSRSHSLTFPSARLARFCKDMQWGSRRPSDEVPIIVPHVLPTQGSELYREPPTGQVVFMHVGTFAGGRRPNQFLRGVAALLRNKAYLRKRVKVIHVGAFSGELRDEAAILGLGEVVEQLGVREYEESLSLMTQATFLVLVESSDVKVGIYTPSKLMDYLWARRPIVALSPREGAVSDLLGAAYPLRADPWNAEEIESVLNQALSLENHDQLVRELDHLRVLHSANGVAREFVRELEASTSRCPLVRP